MNRTRSAHPTRVAVLTVAIMLLAGAAHPATIATGLNAAVGIATDPGVVYFTEWSSGALKKITLSPGCTAAPPCPMTTIASGFSHPQDVAVDEAHNSAYVTTRDDPGTTGALWKVDLTTGTRSLVTFNLGAPHQIVLDVPTDSAYVVSYSLGRLWKIDLLTGSKTTVMSGLGSPIGVAVTADRTRAYVTEQSPPRLAVIDLALHSRIANLATSLTSPFYLAWTDPAQTALYLVQRDPANNVLRYDIPSGTLDPVTALATLPARPSGIALDLTGGTAYVSTNTSIVSVPLASIPMGEPAFLSVGNIPSSAISNDGYADTTPLTGYFLQVKDAPFGGTLNILGNFKHFTDLTATHYRVQVSSGGGALPAMSTWSAAVWNAATSAYESRAIAPDSEGYYEIPKEYLAGHPERWVPPFLMLRWPSGANGTYTFTIELFKRPGTAWESVAFLPGEKNTLTLRIDNDPPDVDVTNVYQHPSTTPLDACAIVNSGSPLFDVQYTAYDSNGHLYSYNVTAYFGHNQSSPVIPTQTYVPPIDGSRMWYGTVNTIGPAGGWTATCSCAHAFWVDAWKRTTNGYGRFIHRTAFRSLTIMNAGPTCK